MAFSVLNLVMDKNGNDSFDSFNGLATTNPLLAFVMTVAMLSMAGIPPTAGFFAKYYIFVGLLSTSYKLLVIPAVLMALVGVYYYFRIIIAMYFKEPRNENIKVETIHSALLVVIIIAMLAVGLFPGLIIELI